MHNGTESTPWASRQRTHELVSVGLLSDDVLAEQLQRHRSCMSCNIGIMDRTYNGVSLDAIDEDGDGKDTLGLQAANKLVDVGLLSDDVLAVQQQGSNRSLRALECAVLLVPSHVGRRRGEVAPVVWMQAACRTHQCK